MTVVRTWVRTTRQISRHRITEPRSFVAVAANAVQNTQLAASRWHFKCWQQIFRLTLMSNALSDHQALWGGQPLGQVCLHLLTACATRPIRWPPFCQAAKRWTGNLPGRWKEEFGKVQHLFYWPLPALAKQLEPSDRKFSNRHCQMVAALQWVF